MPKDKLEDYVGDLARKIVVNAPVTVKNSKQMVNLIEEGTLDDENMARANALRHEGFNSQDFNEGGHAFLEKRKPDFSKFKRYP
ncbi:MAG: hypothetical protein IH924_08420 [Proteobacteria bacterium]|nr:hypothetical protein [Pseudomonadota bacterium]